jgi:hypothetical protein
LYHFCLTFGAVSALIPIIEKSFNGVIEQMGIPKEVMTNDEKGTIRFPDYTYYNSLG